MANDGEAAEIDAWMRKQGLVSYPRSAAIRLMVNLAIRSGLNPTQGEIKAANAAKRERQSGSTLASPHADASPKRPDGQGESQRSGGAKG
jgi:hypothetical protein